MVSSSSADHARRLIDEALFEPRAWPDASASAWIRREAAEAAAAAATWTPELGRDEREPERAEAAEIPLGALPI